MHREWLARFFEDRELVSSKKVDDAVIHDVEEEECKRTLFILRGLPGSGKSTAARIIADSVFENDDYFVDINGNYKFDSSKMPRAKAQCYSGVRQAMEDGVEKIAVANVFCDDGQVEEYRRLAIECGYRPVVMTVENWHGGKNVHDVPEKSLKMMKEKFKVKL